MKNKSFAYVKLHRQDGYVISSGISFAEFYAGIAQKPVHLLLLEAYATHYGIPFYRRLGLEFLRGGEQERYLTSVDADFCWVDFESEADLEHITKQELAELLYFRHKAEPLHWFQCGSLRNRFAYYSHDDSWFTKVYMEHLDDYWEVVSHKLVQELKGRKRSMMPPSAEVMIRLMDMFEEGAVIDFEEASYDGVRIYPLDGCPELPYDVDSIHGLLDHRRAHFAGVRIEYNARRKDWRFYN